MSSQSASSDASATPVAEYVRMSTDHQKYSIENQRALIQAYAVAHGMTIVRTYMDAGKSGVTMRGRRGLSSLLADVVSGTAAFKAILVYDVSRWGRFQDADESAHYEFLCRRAGISMIYCAEQFATDTTPLGSVLKSLKRAMAGEFSRELGVKVSAGKARIGKLGFRIGGPAGYGLRRQLLKDGTVPDMMLAAGQRKSLQTDRVRLIPGPTEEIALVRRMYVQYVYLRRSERDIAEDLNREGHTCFGRPWSRNLVRTILTNEKYIGNNIVGRISARLYTRQVTNPPEKWSRCEGAFDSIVPKKLFEAAEAIRRYNEKVYVSRENILKGMRIVLKREGTLSASIINCAAELPSPQTVGLRFGGLTRAYEALGWLPAARYRHHALDRGLAVQRAKLQDEVVDLLAVHGLSSWEVRPRVLAFGDLSTLEVRICRWQGRSEHDGGWRINYQRSADVDFVLGARLSALGNVHDYVLVPRHDLAQLPVLLRISHRTLIARYTYHSVDEAAKKLADSQRRQRASRDPGARRGWKSEASD